MAAELEDNERMMARSLPCLLSRFAGPCLIFILIPGSVLPGGSAEEALFSLYLTSEGCLRDDILSEAQISRLSVEMGDRAIPVFKAALARRDPRM
jgi:hypothetical protein